MKLGPERGDGRAIQTVAARELLTVARSRAALALLLGIGAVVFGVTFAGAGKPRFLPAVADLVLPMELLVPVVAIALGYRTIASDVQRGELAVIETYPVSAGEYVLGVVVGRVLALTALFLVPFVLVGAYIALNAPDTPTIFATYEGANSPLVYARFVVLTLAFGVVTLTIAVAASALAKSRRSALIAAGAIVVLLVVGLDLLLLGGFSAGTIPAGDLTTALAASPTSAYRGLVFETVLSTDTGPGIRQASPVLNLLALSCWLAVSLVLAVAAVRRA